MMHTDNCCWCFLLNCRSDLGLKQPVTFFHCAVMTMTPMLSGLAGLGPNSIKPTLRQSPRHDFVADVHCDRLNSIKATQTGLSRTCYGLCRKNLARHIEMACVRDFFGGKVLVKVGVIEFGL